VIYRFLVLFLSLNFSTYIQADIFELESLNFGTIAVVDNNNIGTLTIDRFGNTTVSPQLRIISPPTAGRLLIDGLAPNTGISVSLSHGATQMTPLITSQEFFSFTLNNYSDYLVADENGEAEIRIGATISTSGNGSLNFAQTDYQINYQITFLF
jgi:hypothetical protein